MPGSQRFVVVFAAVTRELELLIQLLAPPGFKRSFAQQ